MKRKIRIIVLALCLTLIQPLNVFAGGLINDGIGFRYIEDDGSYAKNCRRSVKYFALHFDNNGYADKTGWDAVKGKWKQTSKGKQYIFDDGRVPTGDWLLSDGIYYTFDDNGYVKSENKSTAPVTSTAPAVNRTTATTNSSATVAPTNNTTTNNSSSTSASSGVPNPTKQEKNTYVLNCSNGKMHYSSCKTPPTESIEYYGNYDEMRARSLALFPNITEKERSCGNCNCGR